MDDEREHIGIDLKAILRTPVRDGELGFGRRGIPLDHYWLDMNHKLDIHDPAQPQAIVNIGMETASIVCYVQTRWFNNIQTVENVPPGYEKIALVWIETPDDIDGPYDN